MVLELDSAIPALGGLPIDWISCANHFSKDEAMLLFLCCYVYIYLIFIIMFNAMGGIIGLLI